MIQETFFLLGFALFYNLNAYPDLVQVNNKFATNGD